MRSADDRRARRSSVGPRRSIHQVTATAMLGSSPATWCTASAC